MGLSNGDNIMDERLVIRLAANAQQINKWLVWSETENEIIASGEVEDSKQLELLKVQAKSCLVICLLPSVDVIIKSVTINGKFNHQFERALPFMLEDDLAIDVEKLHFSVFAKETNIVHVAVCDKNKIKMWLSWLNDAQITCHQFIPEALAITAFDNDDWHALKLNDQWIVRENNYTAWACDSELLNVILETKIDENQVQHIISDCEFEEEYIGNWSCPNPILPMEVLAKGTINNKVNLLSGEFSVKNEVNELIIRWRNPAIALGILFFVFLVNTYTQAVQAERKTLNVKTQVESIYKQLFPHSSPLRYLRIRAKIKSLIKNSTNIQPTDFLVLVKDIGPYFSKNKDIHIESLSYDNKKNNIVILAKGKEFKTFDNFKKLLPESFVLTEGPLDTKIDGVTGLLTIRRK